MQLYAFDIDGALVFAKEALRQVDYFCPECKGLLHLRGGLHRQNHFFHLEITPACRQSGKSAEHLHTQLYMLNLLPENECFLERRFPEINRIADVAWESRKIIFEIQCSPISVDEIQQRNQDYFSVGFEVVWILHDKRFNQRLLSGAEHCLHGLPHYFTNICESGEGFVYDQFSWVEKGSRLHRMEPLQIDVTKPNRASFQKISSLQTIRRRLTKSTLYFSHDLIDTYFNWNLLYHEYIEAAQKVEVQFFLGVGEGQQSKSVIPWLSSLLNNIRDLFSRYVVRPYKLFFQMLLERACK
ncbi:MAG: hypothetical protein H0W50_09145 [Parachlamydiaceae bacterium]|nr:hypothetical protein [Parachlamydiaceae bacterium]